MFKPLNKAHTEKGDFDVVAKITSIHELDEYTNELRIKDGSGTTYHTLALKLKFPHLRAGEVVRIRSAINDDASQKNVLILSHYSNIMTFLSGSKIAKELKAKVKDDKVEVPKGKGVNMNAVVLTEVDKKHAHLAHTPLNELFHEADSDPELSKESTFRTTFSI